MDANVTAAISMISLFLGIASNLIHLVNHTKFKSSCMGKEITGSLDISRIENPSP